ncbi:hypothetical protein [Streptomyces sp. C1-2]|uniref:hypothetical protein n=1 Tax=Streptomyces sp. C1-2 TaxID=2720022 RepID=UPI0014324150|nr:hypothetical protein [Streptomyces sp. C1-2]NJP73390.1 hypothetical protein [Streptomyces sp. C1-2]
MSHTEAPPEPAAVAPETPVQAYAEPAAPAPAPSVDEDIEEQPARRRRRGGVPVEPLVIGTANSVGMAATAAYQVAGPLGVAAAGITAAALGTGAVVQRRRTVRHRTSTAAGRTRGGGGAGRLRSAGGGAPRGGSRGAGSGAGRGGAAPRLSGRTRQGALGSLRSLAPGRPHKGRGGAGGGGKHKRRRDRGALDPNTPRNRNRRHKRGGWVRPAASAARRGMASAARTVGAAGRRAGAAGRLLARAAQRAAAPIRSGWERTGPARRALSRRAGRAGRALWDGALSALAGAGSALWNWSLRSGLRKVREVWGRRRAKRAAAGPAMTGPDLATTPPPVAPYVRRPATAGGTPSTFGGTRMSGGHHFLAPAMELERIASTYTPDGMMQVGRDFAALPDALEHIANAMRVSTARADAEQPLDPRIVEIMKHIYQLQMKASELARELPAAFRKLHDVDISRIENPRKGRQAEAMWDVRANADTTL